MTRLERWQKNNADYLAKALVWLRLKLFWQLLQQHRSQELSPQLAAIAKQVDEAKLQRAARQMNDAANTHPPPALVILAQQFGLSSFEQQVLLLCAAMELDPTMANLCAYLQSNRHRSHPTFALALTVFDDSSWDSISPEGPLRYWRLIEINQPGAQPLTTSALRADERIVSYLKGLNYLDDRLTPLVSSMEVQEPGIALPPSQQAIVDAIAQQVTTYPGERSLPILQLLGADPLSKWLVATHAAQRLNVQLYRLSADLLPTPLGDLENLVRLWQRESHLLAIALYLDAYALEPGSAEKAVVNRFLSRSQDLVFLDTREPMDLNRESISLDVAKPTPAEQHQMWLNLFGEESREQAQHLASQFNLNGSTIQQLAHPPVGDTLSRPEFAQVWDACLRHSRPRLNRLAQRLEAKATWELLVLPEEPLSLLHQMTDQVRQRYTVYQDWGFGDRMNRGFGISALFAGESGTGKTMAAEVMAHELKLDLYRIDLSAVVSKYIGETEKNLRQLFDAAEDGGAILLFDEADALFGKRSEVKDSHDRYANIEINYLLQRMEAYRGLAILATNMKSALDRAFLRRLRFIVNFPFPRAAEREIIWQKAFPPETPTEDLDFKHLARFNLTGGSIHSIVLNAAFQAAQAQTPITMPLLLLALRTEFYKQERPFDATLLNSKTTGRTP